MSELIVRNLEKLGYRGEPATSHVYLADGSRTKIVKEIKYLGYIVTREGIQTDPEKVAVIASWPTLTIVRYIR